MAKKVIKIIAAVLGAILAALGCFLGYLTVTEYRPAPEEIVPIYMTDTLPDAKAGQSLSVLSWNIGYGALGEGADFFMDGGSSVMTAEEPEVRENLKAVKSHLLQEDPDIVLLQEVDQDSRRSHHINEVFDLQSLFDPSACSTFANNYRALVPYPVPPLGKVDSGIMTLSKLQIDDASRISLPCPFSWPVRTANLKRCLLVNRIHITDASGKDTGKQLVVINLHLEAYDSGEGKIAQTKALLGLLEEERAKGNYVIAGGDFNQTFSTVTDSLYPALPGMWHCGSLDAKDFGDGWSFQMDETTPTCRSLDRPYEGLDKQARDPESFQYYMIDGFIVSDNLKVDSVKTQDLGFRNSDHNPVLMEVTL